MAARGLKGLGAGLAVGRGQGRGPQESRGLERWGHCGGGVAAGRGVVGAGEGGRGRASGVLPWPLALPTQGW